MRRPQSILNFERFFWASMVVGVIGTYFAWPRIEAALEKSGSPVGLAAAVIVLAFFGTISVGLWYGIARRASNIVRWIYILWMGFGSGSTLLSLLDPQTPRDTAMAFSLASTALTVASIVCLLSGDAAAWLKGKPVTDARIFD